MRAHRDLDFVVSFLLSYKASADIFLLYNGRFGIYTYVLSYDISRKLWRAFSGRDR